MEDEEFLMAMPVILLESFPAEQKASEFNPGLQMQIPGRQATSSSEYTSIQNR